MFENIISVIVVVRNADATILSCIQSIEAQFNSDEKCKKLMKLKRDLPYTAEELSTASDTFICRNRRHKLESDGIRFAPLDVATKFSTETIFNDKPSFGFHGRNWEGCKYNKAWDILEAHGF